MPGRLATKEQGHSVWDVFLGPRKRVGTTKRVLKTRVVPRFTTANDRLESRELALRVSAEGWVKLLVAPRGTSQDVRGARNAIVQSINLRRFPSLGEETGSIVTCVRIVNTG